MNRHPNSKKRNQKDSSSIRVMVVDDSAFMRRVIGDIVQHSPGMELVGTARNGEDAMRKMEVLQPHILTMDLEMPVMDGISTLKRLMEEKPLPVIIVSSHSFEGSESTMEALQLGAVDFVPKPARVHSGETLEELRKTLPLKIKAAVTARLDMVSRKEAEEVKGSRGSEGPPSFQHEPRVVVAMGASTGGPRALEEILSMLPANLPAAVMITQHMPSGFTSSFARRLDTATPLYVKEAVEGDRLYQGKVYLAQGNYHLVTDKGGYLSLNQGERVHHVRPSFDVMLESLIHTSYAVVAVVLTGMGKDGSIFTKELKARKRLSCVIVQDPSTAIVRGMPEAVISTGCQDVVAPLSSVSREIVHWSRKLNEEAAGEKR